MSRQDTAFGAAILGAALVAAGALDYGAGWIFVVAGGGGLLAAIISAGTRGSLLLGLVGTWLVLSPLMGWAARQWNLFLAGMALVALGTLVGAAGTREETFEEAETSGG